LIPGVDDRVTVAILSALLTFTVMRFVDRVRVKDELRQLARATALPLLGVARALESHSRILNELLAADDEKLRAFYRFVLELVPTSDLDEFTSQVKANSKFQHDLLACLRRAVWVEGVRLEYVNEPPSGGEVLFIS
jgi:hypothetical protein